MNRDDDLARIKRQEELLHFPAFNVDQAWSLGSQLRSWADDRQWPIVIDIRRFDMPLFFAAMAGSAPDNVDWVRRKTNVVQRFHRSSYGFGLELQAKGTTLEERFGLSLADYAAHGGGFPLTVTGAGIIGSITVSGLPQRDDHNLVVRAICGALGKAERDFMLASAE